MDDDEKGWMGLDGAQLTAIWQQLSAGLLLTVEIFVLTLILSLPLGLLVTFGRRSKNVLLRWAMKIYISIMRGTPLMLQLMVVYYGPYYVFGLSISHEYRFIAVLIGFVLNYAAYFAEIYRAGIDSMPQGQYEAASVLGFSRVQAFLRIILPQVIKRILPAITNEVITLVKDTSLASVLSIVEMFKAATSLASAQVSVMPFVAAGLFYYVMNYVVAFGMERIEKKMAYYR